MKEKKSKGLRKVFLMAVATALVIAISVSATLAFLTDSTVTKDNVFTGESADVKGSILEPKFENDKKNHYYSPGGEYDKDPQVKNESTNDVIFTGIRLSFWIKTSTSGSFVQVSYDKFMKYCKPQYGTGTSVTEFNTGDSGKWEEINPTTEGGYNAKDKYFVYKTALAAAATSDPIFSRVKFSEYINIPETLSGDKTVGATEDYINAAANMLNATDQFKQEFQICECKIKVEGYGIKVPTGVSAGDSINGTTAGNSKSTLGKKLAGYDSL